MSPSHRKFALLMGALVIAVVAVFIGGATLTAYAAMTALPSDTFTGKLTNLLVYYFPQDRATPADLPENPHKPSSLTVQDAPSTAPELVKLDSEAPESAEPQGTELTITGTLNSVSPAVWIVDSVAYSMTEETEIEDHISVGDVVKIEALVLQSGARMALDIEKYEAPEANDEDSPDEIGDDQDGEQDTEEVEDDDSQDQDEDSQDEDIEENESEDQEQDVENDTEDIEHDDSADQEQDVDNDSEEIEQDDSQDHDQDEDSHDEDGNHDENDSNDEKDDEESYQGGLNSPYVVIFLPQPDKLDGMSL